MQNLKPTVYSALSSATALSTLRSITTPYPRSLTSSETMPCLTYFEMTNIGGLYADDVEAASDIVFQIDLWGITSLSDYKLAVDDVMTGIGFSRIYCTDLYETDTKINHVPMRYRIGYADPTF